MPWAQSETLRAVTFPARECSTPIWPCCGILPINESKVVQFRLETFNIFNHTQFFGPGAVTGNVDSATFGQVARRRRPVMPLWPSNYTF